MLKIVHRMGDLSFSKLMAVYAEGNRINGLCNYPELSDARQVFQAEQDFYQYLRECFFTVPGAFYAVYTVENHYISALRMEPYRDGLLLEALETVPEERGKGYASSLLQDVLREVKDKKVYAHVHKKNIPSLKVHEKCGFVRISECASYIDGSVNGQCCTMLYNP